MNEQKRKLRFAVIGCGFWSQYQISAWLELENVELVALYNRTISKAAETAARFKVPNYYDSIDTLFDNEVLDFVDIITDVDTHYRFVSMALDRGVAVICQKPLTASLSEARELVAKSEHKGIPFFVHENFRWQPPIRRLKQLMDSGAIGEVFKARFSFCSSFPVFQNQPFLAELDRFVLTDIGSHVLDQVRYLLGEVASLYCLTKTVNCNIKGEDVANVFLEMSSGVHCYVEMSYASILEKDSFPQTLVLLEGVDGSLEIAVDSIIKVTTRAGTRQEPVKSQFYPWADHDYAAAHSSIVEINRDFRDALLLGNVPETSAADNLKTLELVFAAYDSAESGRIISIDNSVTGHL